MKLSTEGFLERLDGERSEPYNPLLGGRDANDTEVLDVPDAKQPDSIEAKPK